MSASVSSCIIWVAWYILCNLSALCRVSAAISNGVSILMMGKCLLYSSWRVFGGGVILYLSVKIST